MSQENKELLLLLESGGFTTPLDSLIEMALREKPKVVKFGTDESYTWSNLTTSGSRPAPIYFHIMRKDPLVLVVTRQRDEIPYILPALTKAWNIYKPDRLDVVYDEDTRSFLGRLVLKEPEVAVKVDVLNPFDLHPNAVPVMSVVTAEVDVIGPTNRKLEQIFKDAEKEGKGAEVFSQLVADHKPEEFLDKYVEYTGWRNQYVFIGYVEKIRKDINPFTGSPYIHASIDIGVLKLDMLVSPRWGVKEGDRVKGVGLLEMWLHR